MSLTLFPQYHPLHRLLTRPLISWTARRADGIITVSANSKKDTVRLIPVSADSVHVIHEAAAPAFRPIQDENLLENKRRQYGLPDRFLLYVLYVGMIEPRKNLSRLIEAYRRLQKGGVLPHPLICVGSRGWGYKKLLRQIQAADLEDRVRFQGYIPFSDLPAIYNLAELFVFPSLYEGFGLPILEAMACGRPVIASGNSSLPEITEDSVEIVDAWSTESIEKDFGVFPVIKRGAGIWLKGD